MKNILITSAGRRVSLVRAFQRELNIQFPKCNVFATDFNTRLSAACQVADKAFPICRIDNSNYIPALLDICLENQVGMIIPTIDTELQILADNIALFNKAGISVIVSDAKFISICRDKRKTNMFFSEKGISIPKEINKNAPTFPLFIKPYNGSLSAEIHLIKKQNELTEYLLNDEKFMFMEYLSPSMNEEYTVDMYYDRFHNLRCLIPRKRIEVRGGEISKGVTVKNEIMSFLKYKLSFIPGAIGCITTQVFFNPTTKVIVGIEINPRFGGGFPLSYEAGGNFPALLIKEYFLNSKIEYFDNWTENTTMLRYDAEIILHEKNNSF